MKNRISQTSPFAIMLIIKLPFLENTFRIKKAKTDFFNFVHINIILKNIK